MGFHGSGWWGYLSSGGDRPKVTWDLFKRVIKYSRAYYWQLFGMLIAILISTGLSLLSPLVLRDLIDNTLPSKNLHRLFWLSLVLLAIPLINGINSVIQRRFNSQVGEGVIYDLRVSLYTHLQRMSLRFFTNTRVGELMSRLNNDVVGAQNAISNTLIGILSNLVQTTALIVVMATFEWRLTIISILILPLFILVARKLGTRLRDLARLQMDANAQMNAMINETLNIGGALLVKLFGRHLDEVSRFRERSIRVRDLGIERAIWGTSFFAIIGLVSAVGTALVYGLGGFFVISGNFTLGKIVAFGAYLTGLYSALQGLANAPVEFATSIVSFERVFEVIDLPTEISDRPDAIELKQAIGELRFDHVTFRYSVHEDSLLSNVKRYGRIDSVRTVLSGEDKQGKSTRLKQKSEIEATDVIDPSWHSQARELALEDISFVIKPGQLLALVGPSGAGKTTMTYLIPRLYDPDSGKIFIDGTDLCDITLDSLTAQVGMVTQDNYLFHDTIHMNLQYARLDATDDELHEAAKAANIHNFIMDLPDQYDTVVGERGYRLSGGEKQRIALARVILKNPRILVLDEATSHLDSESEKLIQEALKRVFSGRTSIVIAHRLSTILSADQILVMDRGKIMERGNHHELLEQRGLYAHLYETQFYS
jgi:ATP-binding cassette subfamily B protein